jgi:hypothetical protein
MVLDMRAIFASSGISREESTWRISSLGREETEQLEEEAGELIALERGEIAGLLMRREEEARGKRAKGAAVLIHFQEKEKSLGHAKKRVCQLFFLLSLHLSDQLVTKRL